MSTNTTFTPTKHKFQYFFNFCFVASFLKRISFTIMTLAIIIPVIIMVFQIEMLILTMVVILITTITTEMVVYSYLQWQVLHIHHVKLIIIAKEVKLFDDSIIIRYLNVSCKQSFLFHDLCMLNTGNNVEIIINLIISL